MTDLIALREQVRPPKDRHMTTNEELAAKLESWAEALDCELPGAGDDCREAATRLRAGAGVSVKPLTWSGPASPNAEFLYDHVFAESALGRYSVEWKSWKEYDDYGVYIDGEFMTAKYTLEEARAAAQADYEARILSTLTTRATNETEEG